MEMSLQGKVALVTGGSRGIGRAIAEAYAVAGARVMISSRKADDLEQTAKELPGEVAWFAANAGDPDGASRCVDATVDRFGKLDVLVNNAATNPYAGPLMGLDLARADKTYQVNVRGVLVWTQAAWRASMQEHGGSIINVASTGGLGNGSASLAWYAMTKAAVIHLSKSLARELAPAVRVNVLAPGIVKTDMARVLWEEHDEVAASYPLGRFGEPEDLGPAALFLASDASAWMTGAVMTVDGGALVRG
jgi:NAD(P)-dependent dehydrogenase (short-subunit alcohol dehydrogenase family)